MRVYRGHFPPDIAAAGCAVTIGNFDGVHRGHQAMLALLTNEARHRGLPACVLSFEPHPRDFFARRSGQPQAAPARMATLRDKLAELERCGIDQVVVARFDERFAARARRPSSTTCCCAAWARATCWSATTSASARAAPATTPCSTRPARATARLRRGAHEQLRGARPARLQFGRARGAGRRRHGRAPPRCWAGPTASAATRCTAPSSAARWAFAR